MEYRGITFTVVQTIWKGWRWSVDQGERESAGTASNRTTAIRRAERFIDDLRTSSLLCGGRCTERGRLGTLFLTGRCTTTSASTFLPERRGFLLPSA